MVNMEHQIELTMKLLESAAIIFTDSMIVFSTTVGVKLFKIVSIFARGANLFG